MNTKEQEHNERVRVLAGKMPTPALRKAVLAIGYVAKFDTGITQGWAVAAIAAKSAKRFRGRDRISKRNLDRALTILEASGVVSIERHRALGKHQANSYTLDYEWNGEIDLSRARRIAAQQTRLAAKASVSNAIPQQAMQESTAAGPDPEWIESLWEDTEPPAIECAVCELAHDMLGCAMAHGNVAVGQGCDVCRRHVSEDHEIPVSDDDEYASKCENCGALGDLRQQEVFYTDDLKSIMVCADCYRQLKRPDPPPQIGECDICHTVHNVNDPWQCGTAGTR